MKGLFAGIILILVVGIGGFFYRTVTERVPPPAGTSMEACTADAKLCPDGSAVGRTGPNCSFAVCPLPNIELVTGSSTIDFVLPAGYSGSPQPLDPGMLALYQKPTASSTSYDTLSVSAFQIGADQTAHDVILAHTTDNHSGLEATSTTDFSTIIAGQNTLYAVTVDRSEGHVETLYYLETSDTVYAFDLIERTAADDHDPDLDVSSLPEHQAIMRTLSTVQVSTK